MKSALKKSNSELSTTRMQKAKSWQAAADDEDNDIGEIEGLFGLKHKS